MNVELVLQPKQEELGRLFYRRGLDAATVIGGGGARAGGKSGGLRRIMLDRRMSLPGTPGGIMRRVWDDVKKNHVEKYWLEVPGLRKFYSQTDKAIHLPNKSSIYFLFAENQAEVDRKFWGPEYYDLFVDQAEQFNEHELQILKTANRWPDAPIGDCKLGLFFNPGGIGTEYLRRVFSPKHLKFKGNERASNFSFVHMFGWDNYVWFQHLMTPDEFYALPSERRFELFITETSEGRKMDALPPSLRAGHLLGNFDSFAGQYFAGVWDESKLILTEIQEERLLQTWWNRWLAHDPGFVHHAAVQWLTSGKVSPQKFKECFGVNISKAENVVVVYRNHTVQETEEAELVRQMVAMTPEAEIKRIKRYFLGQDAWEKDSKGHSPKDTIAEEGRRHGLPYPEQPDNNRIGGWRFIYAMMKKTIDVMDGKCAPSRDNDDFDEEGGGYSENTPLLLISSRCTDVVDAIPMAVRDNKHPGRAEDVLKLPTKADDVLDCLRYALKSMLNPRGAAPLPVQAQELWDSIETESVHTKAMAMIRFEAQNRRKKSSWAR